MYPGAQGIEACGDRGDVSLFDETRTASRDHLAGSPVLKGRVDVTVANPEIFFVRQKPRFEELLKTEPVLAADHGGDPRFLKNALIAALKHE